MYNSNDYQYYQDNYYDTPQTIYPEYEPYLYQINNNNTSESSIPRRNAIPYKEKKDDESNKNAIIQSSLPSSRVKRYFDITSSSRNRYLYPSVCDFSITVNIPSKTTPDTALDPIIDAFPYEYNTLSASTNFLTPTFIRLNVSSINIDNFYTGSYIQMTNLGVEEFKKVISYNGATFTAEIESPYSWLPLVGTPYTVRRALPIVSNITITGPGPNPNTVILSAGASTIQGAYVGYYIFVGSTPSAYQWRLITEYDGSTQTATYTGKMLSPFPSPTDLVEILAFTRDNVIPLVYSSSTTDSSSTSMLKEIDNTKYSLYYEVRLTNLVLPKLKMLNGIGFGGSLLNYSYLYAALYNDQSVSYQNVLFSNNSISNQSVFKVPLTFLVGSSNFITLSFTDMSQTIKIKPGENLHFSVLLPNGEPVLFTSPSQMFFLPEYRFPIIDNPLSQVTATFEIIKMYLAPDALLL